MQSSSWRVSACTYPRNKLSSDWLKSTWLNTILNGLCSYDNSSKISYLIRLQKPLPKFVWTMQDVENKIFKEIMHFAQYDRHKLYPGVMKFTILVDLFLLIITLHIYTLSDLCSGVEKKIYTKKKFYTINLIWPRPGTRTPVPWHKKNCKFFLARTKPLPKGHEILNFGRPFFAHHYCKLCLIYH